METSPRAAALCNHTASPTVWCGHLFGTSKFWGASGHTGRLWRQVSLAVWLGPDMEPQMPTPTGQIKKVLGSSWPLSGCADGFRDTSQSGEGSLHCVWRDHAQRDATSSLSLLGVWAGLLFVSAIKQMALQIRSDFRFSGDQVDPGTSDAVHPREVPARSLMGA